MLSGIIIDMMYAITGLIARGNLPVNLITNVHSKTKP